MVNKNKKSQTEYSRRSFPSLSAKAPVFRSLGEGGLATADSAWPNVSFLRSVGRNLLMNGNKPPKLSFPSFVIGNLLPLSLLLAMLLFLTGCGIQKMVVRKATSPIIDGGFAALMAEDDIELAKTSIESNLKLVEGLIYSDPGNTRLLLVASQGFTAYSLGFAEDENPERAVRLYMRARDYANRWLKAEYHVDLLSIENLDEFTKVVNSLPDKAMPGLFWLGNSWASALLLSLEDMASVTNLPKVEALMHFSLDRDEGYYFGGAHLFYGGYYGSRSVFLGGDPVKAREHLHRQIEITNGQVLLGHLFMVKYVDLKALDGEAAEKRLNHILEFDLDSAPDENRLINRIAQRKAQMLLTNLDEYL